MVIGGGAAGFFGALACARAEPGLRVLILEKGNTLLSKVLVSGGGRCNVTHACFDPAQLIRFYPRGGRELRGAFTRFQPRDTVAWFEERGMAIKREEDGRMFPATDRAQTIADCLLREAGALGVIVQKNAPVAGVRQVPGGFEIELRSGYRMTARAVLLASGGDRGGYALAEGLGHAIIPPVPSLFTFMVTDARLVGLAGVAVTDALVRLPGLRLEQRGPLLVTHWGLSGPAVLRLSAWAARELNAGGYQAELEVNWTSRFSLETMREHLGSYKGDHGRKLVAGHSALPEVPTRLWHSLARSAGVGDNLPWADLTRGLLLSLAGELTGGKFQISGKGEFKDEFVTCGGVTLREVDFRRMESKLLPGLFLAGEVLDIDGITGGFNFQAAWTTGWIAGSSAAAFLSGS